VFPVAPASNGGAYLLIIELAVDSRLSVGRLGDIELAAGRYVYVGSARKGLRQRVERHRRLVVGKAGKRHWHIDALLLHPASRLVDAQLHCGKEECRLSRQIARRSDASVPVPGYGATDCSSGCGAHLYRIDQEPMNFSRG